MGIIGMFRSSHWIRRWGEDGRSDFKTKLNVQSFGSDDLKALPEGLRQTKRLKAWGSAKLTAGDQQTGQQGDWLYYDGRWYECVSCVTWNHTPLNHYQSEFCLVDGAVAKKNLEPPVENAQEEGDDTGDGKRSQEAPNEHHEEVFHRGDGGLCQAEQQGEAKGPVCLPDAREPHAGFVPDAADGA